MALFKPNLSKLGRRTASFNTANDWVRDSVANDGFGSDVESVESLQLSVVYGAVSLIAGKISALPVVLETETGEPVEPPNWLKVPDVRSTDGTVTAPLSFQDLVSSAVTSLLLDGNAYFVFGLSGVGEKDWVSLLHPSRVTFASTGKVDVWEVLVDGQPATQPMLVIRNLTRPGRPEGISPIRAAKLTLETAVGVHRVSANFFARGAIIPGAVSYTHLTLPTIYSV